AALRISHRLGAPAVHRAHLRRRRCASAFGAPPRGAGAHRQAGRAAERALSRHAAEARHRLWSPAPAPCAHAGRTADRARSHGHSQDEGDHHGPRPRGNRSAPQLAPPAARRRALLAHPDHPEWTPRRHWRHGRHHRRSAAARRTWPGRRLPGSHGRRRRRSAMIATFTWYIAHGFRNRAVRRIRRIREPRYAIALIVGVLYLWSIFFNPARSHNAMGSFALNGTAHLFYALGLTALAASWWLVGFEKLPIQYTPAEVQLLFPAPVLRRQLVELKILQAQLPVLLSCVLWLVILGRGSGSILLRCIALWVLFTALYLHRMSAWLVRTSLAEHGAAGARRGFITVLVIGTATVAAAWSLIHGLPALRAAFATHAPFRILSVALHLPVIAVLSYPFRLLLA